MSRIKTYTPAGPVLESFHHSNAFVRAVIGPIGSGKSYAMCNELMRRATEQEPDETGTRSTRWAIVRQSYPELRDTSLVTWHSIFPQSVFGKTQMQSPMRAHHNFKLKDGTRVDAEYIFLSLDHEGDESKLLSLELTGAFINEAQFIRASVLGKLQGRCGRWPSVENGGPTWCGIILDSNAPPITNWMYEAFVLNKPREFDFFHQPSGTSPEAENLHNLVDGYYKRAMLGRSQSYINAFVHAQFSYSEGEKAVHPRFSPTSHVANQIIEPNRSFQLYVGIDFGSTPAAAFVLHNRAVDSWMVTDEICLFGAAATDLAPLIHQRLSERYNGMRPNFFCDPAGNHPGQQIKDSAIDVMRAAGINVYPAASNNTLPVRLAALDMLLDRKTITGEEAFLVSPNCTTLISGLAGAYHWKSIRTSDGDRITGTVEKTNESHICEGLEYALLGAGLGDVVLTAKSERGRPRRQPKIIRSNGGIKMGPRPRQDW